MNSLIGKQVDSFEKIHLAVVVAVFTIPENSEAQCRNSSLVVQQAARLKLKCRSLVSETPAFVFRDPNQLDPNQLLIDWFGNLAL